MNRARVVGLFVLVSLFGISAGALAQNGKPHQNQTFTTIAKGDMSGQQTARQVTVRSAAEWKALWKEHAPTEKLPAVDFARDMVVGVFLGSKPSTGHEVEITGVRTHENELVVEYVVTQPARGTLAAQILTEPYHLVAVPAYAGTVRFVAR